MVCKWIIQRFYCCFLSKLKLLSESFNFFVCPFYKFSKLYVLIKKLFFIKYNHFKKVIFLIFNFKFLNKKIPFGIRYYFDSIISFIAVRSSPSIFISVNAGIQTKFLPLGATKPLVTPH